jgi:hypothetical protein
MVVRSAAPDDAGISHHPANPEPRTVMHSTAPIASLLVLGVVITVLGLFAAGEIAVVGLGLAAAVLGVIADRSAARAA